MTKHRKNQFSPPKINYQVYLHKSLKEKINQIQNYPLTIITAGIATGKTTALAVYGAENSFNNSCWYQLKRHNLNLVKFWDNIFTSLEQNNIISTKTKNLLDCNKVYQSIELLFNDYLPDLDEDVFLILDNFELVNNNELILETISYFIELCPSNFHLIISTKGRINFSKLAFWKVKNIVLLIEEENLMLEQNNIQDLCLEKHSILLSNKEAEMIFNKTNGWILAVDLIAFKVKEGLELKEILANPKHKCQLLFNYLDN